MSTSLTSRIFGQMPSGETVEAYTLKGSGGFELEAITYGGIITRIVAPDRAGRCADVALGFNELTPYLKNLAYFGGIIGRVAGRITRAQFTVDRKFYRLVANDAPNHLHGGTRGFDQRLWTATAVRRADNAPSVRFSYRSPDGEEGYPGNLDAAVTYTVTADNTFWIETEGTTDRATPFTLTSHSYFNLGGDGSGTIEDHLLQVDADAIVACNGEKTLLGKLAAVTGTASDLNEARRLGEVMPRLLLNHGDFYLIRRSAQERATGKPAMVRAGRLTHPGSGRSIEIRTTENYLQFYTGMALNGSYTGRAGVPYGRYAGLCLECQDYPDGVNTPALGDIVLRPGAVSRHLSSYAFSAA